MSRRKTIDPGQDDPRENYSIRLSGRQARKARKIGGGSLSEGIRIAIEKAVKEMEGLQGFPLPRKELDDK